MRGPQSLSAAPRVSGPQRAVLGGEGAPSSWSRATSHQGAPGQTQLRGQTLSGGDGTGLWPPGLTWPHGTSREAGSPEGPDIRPEASGPTEAGTGDECNAWNRCPPCRQGP